MALTQVPPALLTSTTGTGSTVVLSASAKEPYYKW
jgi:hypothetical protein